MVCLSRWTCAACSTRESHRGANGGQAVAFTLAQTAPQVESRINESRSRCGESSPVVIVGRHRVASDGRVYCAIGDHGQDQAGDARCFVYVWEPQSRQLRQIVDMKLIVTPKPGQPAWS